MNQTVRPGAGQRVPGPGPEALGTLHAIAGKPERVLPRGPGSPRDYSELFSEVQRARTLVPTDVMTAMAATTIRPAIKAYSRTSPPCSSRINLLKSVFMTMAPYEDPQKMHSCRRHAVRPTARS